MTVMKRSKTYGSKLRGSVTVSTVLGKFDGSVKEAKRLG